MATLTVKQSGGDYTTLAAACAAASDGDIISIEGTWSVDDTANVTISDSISIVADADSRFNGVVSSAPSHYRLRNTSGHSMQCATASKVITIDGIEIGSASTGVSDELFRINADNVTLNFKNSCLYFKSRTDQQDAVYIDSQSGCVVNFEQCFIWNIYRGVVDAYLSNATVNINSCHIYDVGFSTSEVSRGGVAGFYYNGVVEVNIHNSLLHINTGSAISVAFSGSTINGSITNTITNYADFDSNVIGSNTNNLTFSNNAVSASWVTSYTSGDEVVFGGPLYSGTEYYDLRIVDDAGNIAQDSHITATASGLTIPSSDIAGTSRPQNTNYDVGAYEISSGPAALNISTSITGAGDILSSSVQVINSIATNVAESGDTASASVITAPGALNFTASVGEIGDSLASSIQSVVSAAANIAESGDMSTARFLQSGWGETVFSVNYAGLDPACPFYGDTNYSALVAGNSITYVLKTPEDNHAVSVSTTGIFTLDPASLTYDQTVNFKIYDGVLGSEGVITFYATRNITASIAESGDSSSSGLQVINSVSANAINAGGVVSASMVAAAGAANISASVLENYSAVSASLQVVDSIDASVTEAGDVAQSSLKLISSVACSVLDVGDSVSSALLTAPGADNISAGVSEQGDNLSAAFQVVGSVAANVVETGESIQCGVKVINTITGAITELSDATAASILTAPGSANIGVSVAEQGADASATLKVINSSAVNIVEIGDSAQSSFRVINSITNAITEIGGTVSASLVTSFDQINISVNAIESGDSTSAVVDVLNSLSAALIETGDITSAQLDIIGPITLASDIYEAGDSIVADLSVINRLASSVGDSGDVVTANMHNGLVVITVIPKRLGTIGAGVRLGTR